MIYSYLRGRLGNCLFEIAAGASLAKRMGVPYKALTCNPELLSNPDNCLLVHYLKPYRKTILRRIDFIDSYPENDKKYKEEDFLFHSLPEHDNQILEGYFQSEKYFDKEYIRYLFEIDNKTEDYIQKKYKNVLQLNPVAINVRRGDYLSLEFKHPVCRMSFFEKAISYFESGTKFLVISDDIVWCKRHFKGDQFYFADDEPPIIDLYLQSKCIHNIISNSTFSWWGAWLNPNPNKIVIYPDPWFGFLYRNKKELNTKDLCPDSWTPVPLGKLSYYFYGYYTYMKYTKCFMTILYHCVRKYLN